MSAWLTVLSHHKTGAIYNLDRPISLWLINQFGLPPFAEQIQDLTYHSISLRASILDFWTSQIINEAIDKGNTVRVFSLGAGLDSRWFSHMNLIEQGGVKWTEIDRDGVLKTKQEIFDKSVYSDLYQFINTISLDLTDIPQKVFNNPDDVTLFIAEGVLDYLTKQNRQKLFQIMQQNCPFAHLLIDAQNAFMLNLSNRRAKQNTGAHDLTFKWAPKEPERFLLQSDFELVAQEFLIPQLQNNRSAFFKFLLWALPPLKKGYRVMHLVGC